VILQWTGGATYSPEISRADAVAARRVYQHDLLAWDNYPVVPRAYPRTLRLAPYVGREPGLSESLLGIVANPMVVPELSKIPLFTFADYAWERLAVRPGDAAVRDAPAALGAHLRDRELLAEASPWLDAARWARADLAALDMLLVARGGNQAQAQGDKQVVDSFVAQAKAATFVEYGTPEPLAVGAGVLDKFVADALTAL
jgi:hypothetical protein